jgi:Arc/MetJ family transcription regulator
MDVYELAILYTLARGFMRTNIVIDEALMNAAMEASGARTKREAVEMGLRALVSLDQQQRVKAFRGRLCWQGDLETQRLDRNATGQRL